MSEKTILDDKGNPITLEYIEKILFDLKSVEGCKQKVYNEEHHKVAKEYISVNVKEKEKLPCIEDIINILRILQEKNPTYKKTYKFMEDILNDSYSDIYKFYVYQLMDKMYNENFLYNKKLEEDQKKIKYFKELKDKLTKTDEKQ